MGERCALLLPLFEAESAKANNIAAPAMESRTITSRRRSLIPNTKEIIWLKGLIPARARSESSENEYFKLLSLLEDFAWKSVLRAIVETPSLDAWRSPARS